MAIGKTTLFSGKGRAGDLLDPKNWNDGVVPGVNDTEVIKMDPGGPVGGTVSVGSMMLLGPETITFTGTLNTVGFGGCSGLMVCVGAGAVFAPGATLNDGNTLIVGKGATGVLLAEGSGTTHSTINTLTAQLGQMANGVGTVTIDDAVWNNSLAAFIGENGTGTLNVTNNGSVTFGKSVVMGQYAGSSGHMTIASGGSVVVDGLLRVGGVMAAPAGTGTVSVGSGSHLTVDQSLSVGSGSTVAIAGGTITAGVVSDSITTMAGGVISGFGTLTVTDGQPINDGGIIRATGGNLQINGNVAGKGSIQIDANSIATINSTSLKLAGIAFIGPNATLSLAHASTVTAPISGFAIGDVIRMANVDAASFMASTGMLTLKDHGATVESLHLLGSFAGDTFAVTQSATDAMITLQHH